MGAGKKPGSVHGQQPNSWWKSIICPRNRLATNTLRQVIRVSLGGEKIRLKFSNEYGNSPLHIKAAQLAVARGGSAIDTSSLKEISFGGDKSVSIAPGEVVVSDTLDYELPGLTTMAITLYFGEYQPI